MIYSNAAFKGAAMNLEKYKALVFDCDGVLLNSNSLKSDAFHSVAGRYGPGPAAALLEYHKLHGGVSRYRKFEHLFSGILKRPPLDGEVESLLDDFSRIVRDGLLTCELTPGLFALRERTREVPWMIASGSDQEELRGVMAERGCQSLFDAGIFGSPTPKKEIVSGAVASDTIRLPALMFGDSRLDHECAVEAGLDFVFVFGWTEFAEWGRYFRGTSIPCVEHLGHV